ncbi:RND superfamily putative drug exporter [Paenibacillus sp. DS2015]|uniref:MMPL family transporter n=1 Tax=Paenibacillus sp. DS2015 TaxID=3373917 RepID=UPI003D22ED8D
MRWLLEGWGRFVVKTRWMIVCVWLVIAVVFGGIYAGQLGPLLTGGGWGVPDSGSYHAYQMISENFESRSTTSMSFVTQDANNEVGSTAYSERLTAIKAFLLSEETIESVYTWLDAPEEMKAQFQNEQGNVTIGFIEMNINEGFAQKVLPEIQDRLSGEIQSLNVDMTILGAPALWGEVNAASQKGMAKAHVYAIPIIILVLLLLFRSVISSIMPLVIAGSSIAITMGVLSLFAKQWELSTFIMDSAMMIGIGVGIDFALIFVSRYREELLISPIGISKAISQTMYTAGHAIIFSSLTIMGSMIALLFVQIAAVRSMALGVIVVVFFLLLTSMSLLPAVLAILGNRVNALIIPIRFLSKNSKGWYKLSHRVMKRPVLYLLGSVIILGLLAIPALELRTSTPDVRMLSEDSDVRNGVETLQDAFGIGFPSPIQVVMQASDKELIKPENQILISSFINKVERMDGVASVSSYLSFFPNVDASIIQNVLINKREQMAPEAMTLINRYISVNSETVLIEIISNQHSSSEEKKELVRQIREEIIPAEFSKEPFVINVGGETAEGIDVSKSLRESLVKVLILTLALIFVILFITFKSILLPLKAILLNLLSLGATYGVLVIVFQWGLGSDIFGFGEFGYIQNFIPILLLGLLFSLSTDYEVFLLSRVKEEYDHGHTNEESVALGVEKTAPMISGAAIIMVVVFASFAFAGILPMQQLGLGMAVAIAIDATIVRLIMVPASMKLLGSWNWWNPLHKQDATKTLHK